MTTFPDGFLWGAATAGHQIEGNNVNSDWWAREQTMPGHGAVSGDAVDSYHRYEEDIRLLADAGLNAYRFGLEWSRIEPVRGQLLEGRARALPPDDRHRAGARCSPRS